MSKKARLKLTSLEYAYLDRYKELPEDTIDRSSHCPSSYELVQNRMDELWHEMRLKAKERRLFDTKLSELKRAGCLFLT